MYVCIYILHIILFHFNNKLINTIKIFKMKKLEFIYGKRLMQKNFLFFIGCYALNDGSSF